MLAFRFYAKWSDDLIHLAQHYEFIVERLNSVMRDSCRCKICGQNQFSCIICIAISIEN